MFCDLPDDACRHQHIAALLGLVPNPRSYGDFEGDCPECRHGGFALSAPTKSRTLRNIWSCNCQRCERGRGCSAATVRAAQLRAGVSAWCLGAYDGGGTQEVSPDTARRLRLAVSDILAAPGLKPADIRIMLAEADGRKVPEVYSEFVRFAKSIGIGKTQAQEAAARWCRPSDCSPQTRGAVADASRNTEAGIVVKPSRSETGIRSVSDQRTVGFRPTDITDTRSSDLPGARNVRKSETDQQTPGAEPDETTATRPVLRSVGKQTGKHATPTPPPASEVLAHRDYCRGCGFVLDPALADAGMQVHPTCSDPLTA
jgi:hypothetical protein